MRMVANTIGLDFRTTVQFLAEVFHDFGVVVVDGGQSGVDGFVRGLLHISFLSGLWRFSFRCFFVPLLEQLQYIRNYIESQLFDLDV